MFGNKIIPNVSLAEYSSAMMQSNRAASHTGLYNCGESPGNQRQLGNTSAFAGYLAQGNDFNFKIAGKLEVSIG